MAMRRELESSHDEANKSSNSKLKKLSAFYLYIQRMNEPTKNEIRDAVSAPIFSTETSHTYIVVEQGLVRRLQRSWRSLAPQS